MKGTITPTDGPLGGRFRWVLAAACAYLLLFVLSFVTDVLFLYPVLDARENLALAGEIAGGTLADEPFYRAMLYPWLLSLFPAALVPWAALVLGVGCHLINSFFCGRIAHQVWGDRRAARFSGLLYLVYPVALFFSVQVLDITFALSFFLASVDGLLRMRVRSHKALPFLTGAGLALAVLARPNFLPAVLLAPLVIGYLVFARRGAVRPALLAFLAAGFPLLSLLLLQGGVNAKRSGEFRILPWQGSYNLYAANRPGANGKYYEQQLSFPSVPPGTNTTRMESTYLYRQWAGPNAPQTIDAMGDFWRARTQETIAAAPFDWLALMGRKGVYLLNDWEQYNNLTYAFHKQRLAPLKWNPLGWGLLLIGSSIALFHHRKTFFGPEGKSLSLLFLAYAAGVLLFFVSARFRLPLAPFLAVACGGLVQISLKQIQPDRRVMMMLAWIGLLAWVTFGDWFDARNRSTFRQDRILMAQACLDGERDAAAAAYARQALEARPDDPAARTLYLNALFNQWLVAEGPKKTRLWADLGHWLEGVTPRDPTVRFIKGLHAWRAGDPAGARVQWAAAVEQYGARSGLSRHALDWTDPERDSELPPELQKQLERLLAD